MTGITFLASSKPFNLPDEIMEHNNRTEFARVEDFTFFTVQPLHAGWQKEVEGIFSLPYLYEAEGLDSPWFMRYLEKYMEPGDVFEVYSVPNQHALEQYIRKMHENPDPVRVNTGSYTYEDSSGRYQWNSKNWREELSRRNFLTPRGVTTFEKY